ncbi:twin-arginine translocase subunit TatC [Gracilibacillus oryzae]|uniref:Sec-independent protein translocase protein TatC n=1 Tax=Gracilibacillus oryzae TaxID=1672701 RepID=A0A7C8KPX1_9BACI|nr:twin-arginine translocase subunit TatC [Gracilibacillus oryzae]KAB8133626.1 twin-arginine translocase subunit TatC [Gracilibacillus oryzae]
MEKKELNLIGHLEELHKRIIIVLLAFVVFFITSFIFVQDIYNWLIRDFNGKLSVLGPSDILWVYMMIAGVFAIAATIPIIAYQIWKFITPALTKEESKLTLGFIPGLFILFIFGISFGYFVLFPIVLEFLLTISAGQFNTMFTADKYFLFMLNLSLPLGFLFEMPLLVMFLTRLGVLNPVRLAKARKLSYFSLVIISVLITPPDFISDILVIVPLLLLYELSILISKVVYKKRLATEGEMLA